MINISIQVGSPKKHMKKTFFDNIPFDEVNSKKRALIKNPLSIK